MRSALVCGLGTVGLPFALLLARMGCERLVLVDFDRVEAKNLRAQPYLPEQIGQLKVDAAAALIRAGSAVQVTRIADDVRTLGLGALAGVELLAACPDNRAAELYLARAAVLLGRPFVRLATERRGLGVTLIPAADGDRVPCTGCLLTAEDLRLSAQRESCLSTFEHNPAAGLPTLAQLGAMAAALALDALVHDELAPARLVTLHGGVEPRLATTELRPSPGCRLHPFPFRHAPLDFHRVEPEAPVADLLAWAAGQLAAPAASLLVEADVPLALGRVCAGPCGRALGPAFLDYRRQGLRCPRCGGPVVQEARPALTVFDGAELVELGASPLSELSPPPGVALRFATATGASCGVRAKTSEDEGRDSVETSPTVG